MGKESLLQSSRFVLPRPASDGDAHSQEKFSDFSIHRRERKMCREMNFVLAQRLNQRNAIDWCIYASLENSSSSIHVDAI